MCRKLVVCTRTLGSISHFNEFITNVNHGQKSYLTAKQVLGLNFFSYLVVCRNSFAFSNPIFFISNYYFTKTCFNAQNVFFVANGPP